MPSTINPNNINILYPIAGQDNDTQGFRDNFRNIKNNLNTASQEITALQANVALTPRLNYVSGNVAAPPNYNSTGTIGQLAWDSTHFYICIGTDSWIRCTLAAW